MYRVHSMGRVCAFFGAIFLPKYRKAVRHYDMKVIKKINTSAAVALDSTGKEIVILGKGVGFPQVPYELTDMARIERTFYDINPKYLAMLADISQPILMASAEISEQAEIELHCQLNPNLPITLADHLKFAIERLRKGIDLTTPIAYDVRHLYPKEAKMGIRALDTFKKYTNVTLPDSEAVDVAMHLINAEVESGDMHSLMMTLKIISEVEKIVERQLYITLDKDSYYYSRFTMHLRYLIQRLSSGRQTKERGAGILRTLARECPEIHLCALQVSDYLKGTWDWQCNDEEVLYLMMHINRVQEKTNQ